MRVVLRLVTALLGLGVAVLGVLLLIELVGLWLRPHQGGLVVPWRSVQGALDTRAWTDTSVRVAAMITAAAGLLLLIIAAKAGRTEIRLRDPAPEVTVSTDPRSLARLVGHQVRAQDGVRSASVTAGRKRVQVKATGRFRQLGDLPARVRGCAEDSVGELPMSRPPKVSVSVSPPKERT